MCSFNAKSLSDPLPFKTALVRAVRWHAGRSLARQMGLTKGEALK
jgi:hypothetical protein